MTKTASPVWSRAECDGLLQVHHAEQSGKRTGSCEMKCGAGRQKMRREFWIHKVRSYAAGILPMIAVALVLCILTPARPAYAYTDVDQNRKGSLTVKMDAGAGFAFQIYQIGKFDRGGAAFVPTEELTRLNVDLGDAKKIDLGSGRWSEYAATLAGYAPRLTRAMSAETDGNGKALFQNVTPGVYLVLGTNRQVDRKKYTFSPMVVSVPTSGDGQTWTYDTTADAKFSTETIPEERKPHGYTVVKYWLNDTGKGRPTAISVTVYRRDLQGDGSYGDWKAAQTYTLSEDNHWSAAWSDRTGAEFQVAENGTAVNADGTSYQVSISTSHGTDGQGNPYTWFSLTNRKPGKPENPGKTEETPPSNPTDSTEGNGNGGEVLGSRRGRDGSVLGTGRGFNRVRTGDDSNMNLWLVICIAAGGVLALWGAVGMKKRK